MIMQPLKLISLGINIFYFEDNWKLIIEFAMQYIIFN